MNEEEFELKISRMKNLYPHRIIFEQTSANHEPISDCDRSDKEAFTHSETERNSCEWGLANETLVPKKLDCSCGCHQGTVKHSAPCRCQP